MVGIVHIYKNQRERERERDRENKKDVKIVENSDWKECILFMIISHISEILITLLKNL